MTPSHPSIPLWPRMMQSPLLRELVSGGVDMAGVKVEVGEDAIRMCSGTHAQKKWNRWIVTTEVVKEPTYA